MIVGVGVDIAEVDRIARSLERFGERFLMRIYTPDERAYCLRGDQPKLTSLAARFAAKEAAAKALGVGIARGVSWQDFSVGREASGKPTLKLVGRALEIAEKSGVRFAHISLTHTTAQAIAFVVLES